MPIRTTIETVTKKCLLCECVPFSLNAFCPQTEDDKKLIARLVDQDPVVGYFLCLGCHLNPVSKEKARHGVLSMARVLAEGAEEN